MDTPQNASDLRRFICMVNQLGRSIPHLAEKTQPIRDLLSKKKDFLGEKSNKLKAELSSTPVFAHYDPDKKTILSAYV